MENRFGIKDFFLFVLMMGLIVVVLLAMKQYDRQWTTMQAISEQLTEQTRELSQLRRSIQQGVRVSPTAVAGNPTRLW